MMFWTIEHFVAMVRACSFNSTMTMLGCFNLLLVINIRIFIALEDFKVLLTRQGLTQHFNSATELSHFPSSFAGVSRSATVIIGFLMKQHDISYDEAFRIVKAKKSDIWWISPSLRFLIIILIFILCCSFNFLTLLKLPFTMVCKISWERIMWACYDSRLQLRSCAKYCTPWLLWSSKLLLLVSWYFKVLFVPFCRLLMTHNHIYV